MPRLIRLVEGERAVVVEGPQKTLVVSDTHVGLEESISKKGVHLPSQSSKMAERIVKVQSAEECDSLVLLGDLKDAVLGVTPWSLSALAAFFDPLRGAFKEVLLVPGNHDGGVEAILPTYVKLASSRGVMVEDGEGEVALLHGHSEPTDRIMRASTFVMGHRHFILRVGRRSEPLWIRGRFGPGGSKSLVVLPPFNTLLSGSGAKNPRGRDRSFVSRVLSRATFLEAVTLDGTSLGNLKSLEQAVAAVEY